MANRCTVLMYHATLPSTASLGVADPHYAISLDAFDEHLECIAQRSSIACSVEFVKNMVEVVSLPVGMTFDDGHASNWFAAQSLAKRGWTATFFVNPCNVGKPDFLTWDQLRSMSNMGMSIQSHGQFHRYQDDCTLEDQWEDIHNSKQEIEHQLKMPVTTFAPPGGRLSSSTAALAQRAGYSMINTSRVGVWRVKRDSVFDVPRFAVLTTTTVHQLDLWIAQSPIEVAKQVLRYKALDRAKKLLGNGRYEQMRSFLLDKPKDH